MWPGWFKEMGGGHGVKNKCVHVLQSKLTWGPYVWFHMWRAATSTISGRSTPRAHAPTSYSQERRLRSDQCLPTVSISVSITFSAAQNQNSTIKKIIITMETRTFREPALTACKHLKRKSSIILVKLIRQDLTALCASHR